MLSLLPLAAPGLLGGLRHALRARGVVAGLAWVHSVRARGTTTRGMRTRGAAPYLVRAGGPTTHGMRAGGLHRRLPSFTRRRRAPVVPGLELLAGFLLASGHRLVPSSMWARQANPDTRDGSRRNSPQRSGVAAPVRRQTPA